MEGSSSDHHVSIGQTIVLNILSPSTEEIPNKLSFSDIPVSTTVRALKEKIQYAVAARPSLQRQRLIYQGKVLASDQASLKDVFGQDAIDRPEPLSLHLVLSPPAVSHTPSSVPTATNPIAQGNVRQQWTTPFIPPHNNPAASGQPSPSDQQGTTPNVQQAPMPMPPGFNPPAFHFVPQAIPAQQGQTPIPPQLQSALNSHLMALNQQFVAHLAAQGHQHVHHGQPHNHTQVQYWQQPMAPQPSFQQIVAQQQQARAAAGQHGLAQNAQGNGPTSEQDRGNTNNVHIPQTTPPNTNTVVRENHGPNGESFRMVIQSTSISRPNSGLGQRPHSQPAGHTLSRSFTPTNTGPFTPPPTGVSATTGTGAPPYDSNLNPQVFDALNVARNRLSLLERSVAEGTAPSQVHFDQLRASLDHMFVHPGLIGSDPVAQLRRRLRNVSIQAENLRANHSNIISQVLPNQQASPSTVQGNGAQQAMPVSSIGRSQLEQQVSPAATATSTFSQAAPTGTTTTSPPMSIPSQIPAQQSSTPDIYLLSSPTGPHSLLVSPSGVFSTSLTLPLIPNITYFSSIPTVQSPFFPTFPSLPSAQIPNNASTGPQQPQPPPNSNQAPTPLHVTQAQAQAQQAPQAQQQIQNQQQQQQQQNQARDLIRILLPISGHLWLLIRLFGFVYFFTAGGGQRRAILLGIAAFIVFIANTGALRPIVRAVWEPVRRHIEGLVPLAGADRNNPQQERRQQPQRHDRDSNPNGEANRGSSSSNQRDRNNDTDPTPQDLADRLLRDRQNQSLFRRAERAIALFVASLVPGVGERHIAARDAAEAERRRAEEEREKEREANEERGREVREMRERADGEEREMEREEVRRESLVEGGVGSTGVDVGDGDAGSSGTDVIGGVDGTSRKGQGLRERGIGGQQQQQPAVEI
ncbi:MAG: hypothetical protein Q9181_000461 [Wetmoreana brouardii]